MAEFKTIHLDTSLAEFTYTVARNATLPMKRRLPEKLFRAINTEKGAMRFAMRSTLDEKRAFFSYLGIEHFMVFADMKTGQKNDFREIFKEFDISEKPSKIMAKLSDQNVYVSSNKEHCFLLGLTAQTMDTKSYVKNMELVRSGYHVKHFKNKIYIDEYNETNETRELVDEFAKFVNGVMWASDSCEQITGVDTSSLRILIYYYQNRQAYIENEKIRDEYIASMSVRAINLSIKKLHANLLIQRHAVQSRREYTITAKGILAVNQFREKVIKSLDF